MSDTLSLLHQAHQHMAILEVTVFLNFLKH
uniref:Uncharacterized protein n=1 Tax=Rhizophora mucronata TaxID=61149 RepID=A0A2P2NLM9_RHIMU